MTETETSVASLLDDLRVDLATRRIRTGLERLDAHAALIAGAHTPQLVWRVAQWIDVGWRDLSLLKQLLNCYQRHTRPALSLADYAAIRMAEGMAAMSEEESDAAIHHFNTVLVLAPDLDDREMLAIANFWKARCHRQKGEYDDAMVHAARGRELALECGYRPMAAVMQSLEGWLCFQKGRLKEALRMLAAAEEALDSTDDAVTRGNIQSACARIYRQEGQYDRAIAHFGSAIDLYREFDAAHPNLARTLANRAYVKRLVALDLRRRIDADVVQHRKAGAEDRDRFQRLCDEASADLDNAAALYRVHPKHRGAGIVHLNRGLLHLDNGALDLAGEEAAAAYMLGEDKQDAILMARARILACMTENAKLDEGIEEDPRGHANAALEFAREAIDLAHHTENRRLLARAHTWHGLTLSNEIFRSHDAALEAMNQAVGYLAPGFHDTAWQDLQTLKARVLKADTIDETLRAWSNGAVGRKTFRQISDQFAEILIPKIWELEGRKIARVATRLAISPKKVKRALLRAGAIPTS